MEHTTKFIITAKGDKRLLYVVQGDNEILVAKIAKRPSKKNKKNVKHGGSYWKLLQVKKCSFPWDLVVTAFHAIKGKVKDGSTNLEAFEPREHLIELMPKSKAILPEQQELFTSFDPNTLTDEQKLKLISHIGGQETYVKGVDYGYGLLYYIVPHKKLSFLVTEDSATGGSEKLKKLIVYILNLVTGFKKHMQESGKRLSDQTEQSDTELTQSLKRGIESDKKLLAFSVDFRTNLNLTPGSIVQIHEDKSFFAKSAPEAIQAFFQKLLDGKLFLSINIDFESIAISRWTEGTLEQIIYNLDDEKRSKDNEVAHLCETRPIRYVADEQHMQMTT